ncbi:Uncharacterised protein [Staphylococcus aureus]|nr:Uncharacterised protein [Staphylococcus aureus]
MKGCVIYLSLGALSADSGLKMTAILNRATINSNNGVNNLPKLSTIFDGFKLIQ